MIFQGDIVIKTAIELGIEDMRKNDWLIDDMLSDLVSNPILAKKYGQKEIDRCKEWFRNQAIDVKMGKKRGSFKLPGISIHMAQSPEKEDMKSLSDESAESVVLLPKDIGKQISYIVKPFVPVSYDKPSGLVTLPSGFSARRVDEGMIMIDVLTGTGWTVAASNDKSSFYLPEGTTITGNKFAVVPQFPYYKARRRHSFFQETYVIGCHAHGEENEVLWLWSIALYSLLRYKEVLLEGCGFAQSTLSSGDLTMDPDMDSEGGENAYARHITLTGQVENSWLSEPRRVLEAVALESLPADGVDSDDNPTGLRIINMNTPDEIEEELLGDDPPWKGDQDE